VVFVQLSLSFSASDSALYGARTRAVEHMISFDDRQGLRTLSVAEAIVGGSPEPDALGGTSTSSSEL
jgi:hypothetical protein